MPVLQAFNISYQFEYGEPLFRELSCSLTTSRVAIVGRNGVGKSILASILAGELAPCGGSVILPASLAYYRQQPSSLLGSDKTIAEFLNKAAILEALAKIAAGDCHQRWFDIIADDWECETTLCHQLQQLGLPPDPHFRCANLSGGQLARLQLWRLFEQKPELLILDEPSNHLDEQAKQWLFNLINDFSGAVLLVSHDRELLQHVDEIWELSSLGLTVFGGNYDHYMKQKSTAQQAIERQLLCVEKQQKQIRQQEQIDREKAERRARQGKKLRQSGSQSKMLLDGKKESASASVSKRNKNMQSRQALLQQKAQLLQRRHESSHPQKLYLSDPGSRHRMVINMLGGVLPYGRQQPLDMQIAATEKVRLTGNNGCGKSTLLKTLSGELTLQQGKLKVNKPLFYLDQHFAVVSAELSLLDNMLQRCPTVNGSQARTLLAGLGFRRDRVFQLAAGLSGGEKMKLAMLIASHQPQQPFLLLDEPDNHLDIESKIVLAQALNNYQDGFLLVTHDPIFAAETGVVREWDL